MEVRVKLPFLLFFLDCASSTLGTPHIDTTYLFFLVHTTSVYVQSLIYRIITLDFGIA